MILLSFGHYVILGEKEGIEAEEKAMTVRQLAEATGRAWLLFVTFL